MRKTYNELTFTDDFMFSKILYSNPELTRSLLELILDRKISRVESVAPEKPVAPRYGSHGVRFDVYAEDDKGSVFDIEMQVRMHADLPKRSRYYHSMLDMDQLRAGEDYDSLRESYVIFICREAIQVAIDEPVYYYQNRCENHPELLLNDGNYTVFVNACYQGENVSDEMRAFLEYVRSGRATGDDRNLAHRIENDLTMAREYKRWEAEFMTLEEKLKDEREEGRQEGIKEGHQKGLKEGRQEGLKEGRQEGIKEGLKEGQREIIERMLQTLPAEDVSRMLGMDEAELKKIIG